MRQYGIERDEQQRERRAEADVAAFDVGERERLEPRRDRAGAAKAAAVVYGRPALDDRR